MQNKHYRKMLIAALGGLLMFYFSFWSLATIFLMASAPWSVHSITISIAFIVFYGLCQFPLALLVGLPVFLLCLIICTKITSRFYLSVVCHALLAIPLTGLILASDIWAGPRIVQDWHDVGWLAARWLGASLPGGAMGGLTSWVLRPPFSRGAGGRE